jgi:plasmid stabilization system protein ParE
MKVVYAQRALADLMAIEAYIAQHNPLAAKRVLSAIKSGIDALEQFPKLGLAIDNDNRYRLPIERFLSHLLSHCRCRGACPAHSPCRTR